MPLLQWKDEYSVGIAAVDYEHKELIGLINRLYEELSSKSKGADASAESFFGDLLRSISAHFALEEQFMRAHSYDQLVQHKADHERLLDELREMMDDMIGGPTSSMASHCSSKLGGLMSPASRATSGPQLLRKRRTASSAAASRFGGGSGIHRLS